MFLHLKLSLSLHANKLPHIIAKSLVNATFIVYLPFSHSTQERLASWSRGEKMFRVLGWRRIDNERRRVRLVGPLTIRMCALVDRKGSLIGFALYRSCCSIGFWILTGSFLEGA